MVYFLAVVLYSKSVFLSSMESGISYTNIIIYYHFTLCEFLDQF